MADWENPYKWRLSIYNWGIVHCHVYVIISITRARMVCHVWTCNPNRRQFVAKHLVFKDTLQLLSPSKNSKSGASMLGAGLAAGPLRWQMGQVGFWAVKHPGFGPPMLLLQGTWVIFPRFNSKPPTGRSRLYGWVIYDIKKVPNHNWTGRHNPSSFLQRQGRWLTSLVLHFGWWADTPDGLWVRLYLKRILFHKAG